ncbi:MAG: YeeE/YedE family protein [Pseudomonadota bacterium]
MLFESFSEANSTLLWAIFAIAVVMGAVVNKTNFCTMGAVSDVVNMGDWGRMRAWFFAIAVAVIGVTVLEANSLANPANAFPPYRMGQLIWAENLFGGLIFGIGMTLASGCGNKTLIRIGGGNIKSIMVFLIIGVIAYFMINPLPGSDQTLMSLLFFDWIRPLAVDMGGPQDLGSVLAGESADSARLWIGVVLSVLLLVFVFKSAEFRGSFDNILGGLVVGLAILGAWYVTSNVMIQYDDWGEEVTVTAREFLDPVSSRWDMAEAAREDWEADKPDMTSMSPQSFTFINPMGQTVGYTAKGLERSDLSFGVIAVLGIIAGSLLWAILSRGFRFEWFSSVRDFFNHFIGAILMGFGGVLAMGCTIGQGITGVSTLAIGSMITLVAIILGSALTMKVQYYKLVYEEEASFAKALIAGLCDMKLLPNGLRRLDKV